MTNNAGKNDRKPCLVRTLIGATLVFLGLLTAGCGGGGGHSSGVRVASVTPATGPFIGGATVTIAGTRFADGVSAVMIGGRPCTDIVVVDDTTLTCVTPAGTPGLLADVQVTASRGQGRLNGAYRYFDALPLRSDLNGDGVADLVVAAPLDGTAGANAGAVLVFFGSSDANGLLDRSANDADVRLLAQNTGDNFGVSICAGDVNGDGKDDLVIGANLADVGAAADAGMAYVFYGPFTTGSTRPALAANVKLSGETVLAGDRFGSVVDLGDVDGNGKLDVCVSAPQHDNGNPAVTPGALDTGCVYIFKGGNTLASRGAAVADFKLDGANRNDRLGASFAFGDIDGDGDAEMLVGCPQQDPWTPVLLANAGAVYAFECGADFESRVANTTVLQFTGEDVDDNFGATVAVGDVDGDGVGDLLVGAPGNDYYETNGGAVYVFRGGAALASRGAVAADIKLRGTPTHDSFGKSLRVTDLNGDGVFDLLVGAPHADYFNDGNGRTYLFYGSPALADTIPTFADAMFNGENAQDEQLGTALSVVDINADHIADLVLSAARSALGAGRVYLYLSPASGQHVVSTADIKFSGTQPQGLFGAALAEGQ